MRISEDFVGRKIQAIFETEGSNFIHSVSGIYKGFGEANKDLIFENADYKFYSRGLNKSNNSNGPDGTYSIEFKTAKRLHKSVDGLVAFFELE